MNVKIYKILNNNVIISLENDKEIVLMGKGIGYQKKSGDYISSSLVEKRFILNEGGSLNKIGNLIKEIDLVFFEIAQEIVEHANLKLTNPISDFTYFGLVDHINGVLNRTNEGAIIRNMLLWELKSFYPTEYEIGLFSLEVIKKYTGQKLLEDEAGFIAFHIINGSIDTELPIAAKVTQAIHEVINVIKYILMIDLDETSFYYQRFLIHLKFLMVRLFLNNTNLISEFSEIQKTLVEKYPKVHKCVVAVSGFIKKNYHYTISNDEELYLTIHLINLVKVIKEIKE